MGWRILIVVVLQTAALFSMVGMKQYTLSTGTPIVLKTEPIDPRSLFSGDYVRLNYAISELSREKLAGDQKFQPGDRIYVVLQQDGEFWQAISVHPALPAGGQTVIKGRVERIDHSLHIKYGVENYFVPEGEGLALERPKPGETVSIRLVVDRAGNAAIKAVLINGQERYVEKVF